MIFQTIKNLVKPYIGIPAPDVLQDDPWFGPAPETEKSISLKEAREKAIEDQQIVSDEEGYHPIHSVVVEPDDIHEKMYRIATSGGNTTIQLDPLPQLGGGSEQYQSGPGGWSSGTGLAQFR